MARKTATYADYVADADYMQAYMRYQSRYAQSMRESDKVLLGLVLDAAQERGEGLSLLDLGCSTGNFLRHARLALPAAALLGGDIGEGVVAAAQADPDLAGISFRCLDTLNLPPDLDGSFDVVVTNASTYCFSPEEYARALGNVARMLRPGGRYLAFEWFHPHAQELAIQETSPNFPQGHPLHSRSYRTVAGVLADAGLMRPSFMPFSIPIDLQDPGEESIATRTVATAAGERLCFRGALFQPWCFLSAVRA